MKKSFVFAALIFASPLGVAQSQPVDQGKLVKLIDQLGSVRYKERELAAQELLKMGRGAKGALIEGLRHPDQEVSLRCQQLLPQALALDLAHRIEVFEKDVEGKAQHDLPGWKVYREKIGSDANSRKLFVDMIKLQGNLLELMDEGSSKLTDRVSHRTSEIYQDLFGNPFGGRVGGFRPAALNASELCCLLFIASNPAYKPTQQDWLIVNLFSQPTFMEKLKDVKNGSAYRKVFFGYMDAKMDDNMLGQTTWLMAQHNIKEAADVYAKALRDGKATQSHSKANAICTIGTLGDKSHIKSIEPILKDTAVLQQFQLNGLRGDVRMQDIALAITIHLSGKKPTDYGFKIFSVFPNQPIQYHQLGFSTDEERAAAFKKWEKEAAK